MQQHVGLPRSVVSVQPRDLWGADIFVDVAVEICRPVVLLELDAAAGNIGGVV